MKDIFEQKHSDVLKQKLVGFVRSENQITVVAAFSALGLIDDNFAALALFSNDREKFNEQMIAMLDDESAFLPHLEEADTQIEDSKTCGVDGFDEMEAWGIE